jgi:regulator of chromosome condensation
MTDPVREPKMMERKLFQNKNIKKIISGENHALALAGNTLYGWGNSQMGQIGKMLDPTEDNEKKSVEWSLKPHAFSTKNVVDIFTGKNHSFSLSMKGKRKVLKSWGLNCFKQLGHGNRENTCIPTEIDFFVEMDVKYATGGDNHSLVLLENGDIYVWGRNDRGQCGLTNEKKEDENVERDEDNFIISTPTKLNFNKNNNNENNDTNPIYKFSSIASSMDFSYALDKNNNQVFSWGTGDSYDLGTKEEDDANTPYEIPKEFFKNQIINNISLGANHVIITMRDPSSENQELPSLEYDVKKASEELSRILELNKTKTSSRKRKSNIDFIVPETSDKRNRKKVDYTEQKRGRSNKKESDTNNKNGKKTQEKNSFLNHNKENVEVNNDNEKNGKMNGVEEHPSE